MNGWTPETPTVPRALSRIKMEFSAVLLTEARPSASLLIDLRLREQSKKNEKRPPWALS